MRPVLLRARPPRAAGRRAPRAAAVLVAAVAALSACGGGVAESAAEATAGAPASSAASSAPADPGSAGEGSSSGAVIADGAISFPADRGVPELELPDGATAYDTTFNASIGISVVDVDAAALVQSLSDQLTAAGFTVEQLSDDLAQATKEGAAQVTLAGLGEDSVDIAVSPAP